MLTRRRRYASRKEFLWPFIVMVFAGLIVVLIIQLILSFFEQKEAEMRAKANFYVDYGRGEIMEWGSENWIKAYNGGVVLDGDSIRTKSSSAGSLVFYNGTEARMAENTELTMDVLDNKGSRDILVLEVDKGEVFVSQLVNDMGYTEVTVKSGNFNVYAEGAQFDILNREDQAVRVLSGDVIVELVERTEGEDVVIDEIEVGVGQELFMSESDVADLIARTNMNFLQAITDEWKQGDFYLWNKGLEDGWYEGTEEVPEVDDGPVIDVTITTGTGTVETSDVPEDEVLEYEEPALVLTTPETNPYILEGDQIYIIGTVSGYASKIIVTSYTEDGTASDYKLSLFEAGGTEWSYNAAYIYGNLHEGENEYVVTSYNYDGDEADSMTVTINVPEGTFEQELACTLSAPVVAQDTYDTSEGYVSVFGTIDCAYGIVVNGYSLSLFKAGDTTWSYTASLEFGNLAEGENTYEVYSVDKDGNKSESVYFTINYQPAAETGSGVSE